MLVEYQEYKNAIQRGRSSVLFEHSKREDTEFPAVALSYNLESLLSLESLKSRCSEESLNIDKAFIKIEMSVSVKACLLLLLVSVTMGAHIQRFNRNNILNEILEPNELLTPPQDPAINTFPKEPDVPLIPNCVHSGYFRDPFNCRKFYHCIHSEAIPITYYCRQGLIFNENTDECDEPNRVVC